MFKWTLLGLVNMIAVMKTHLEISRQMWLEKLQLYSRRPKQAEHWNLLSIPRFSF